MRDLSGIKKEFFAEKERIFNDTELLNKRYQFCVEYSLLVEEYIYKIIENAGGCCALAAAGSFCRRELAPLSDIDIMFIFPEVKGHEDAMRESVTMLWDAGIEVSHTVREFSDIERFLKDDLHAFTQFFETRFIMGNEKIYYEWTAKLVKSIDEDVRKKLIFRYFEDIELRYRKYGSSAKMLEPNVKFSAGGLRDLHCVEWIYHIKSNMVLNTQSETTYTESFIKLLNEKGVINKRAANRLLESYALVLFVRNNLHLTSGRRNDRLEFRYQEQISKMFYPGSDGWKNFMKDYFYASNILHRFSKTMIKGFKEQIIPPISDILSIELDDDYRLKGRTISINENRPLLLSDILRVYYYRGVHDARFDENLRSLIIESVIDLEENRPEEHLSSVFFREILRMPSNVAKTLNSMNEIGVLGALLPEFREMVGFFQPGVYHCYTADEHTLVAITNLEKLIEEHSRLATLFKSMKKKDIIYLAALFHDIAKPINIAGHEILGGEIAGTIMPSLGYEQEEINLVQFLIRHHLTMEQVAFRRNLNDPSTLNQFAAIFPDIQSLELLYLLTYADLSAVNPTVWTHWKSDLLFELYRKTRSMLENQVSAVELINNATRELIEAHNGEKPVNDHLKSIDDPGYLQHYSKEEIDQHVHEIERGTKLSVFFKNTESYTNVSVITKDSDSLLSYLCGTLSVNDLNIIGAKIFTRNDSIAIDSFNVTDYRTNKPIEESRYDNIRKDMMLAINHRLQIGAEIERVKSKWKRLEDRIFKRRGKIKIEFENHEKYTIIDIFSPDRLGLLYKITKKMHELDLSIYLAKISTRADDVVDSFYVLKRTGEKVSENEYELIRLELTNAIKEII